MTIADIEMEWVDVDVRIDVAQCEEDAQHLQAYREMRERWQASPGSFFAKIEVLVFGRYQGVVALSHGCEARIKASTWGLPMPVLSPNEAHAIGEALALGGGIATAPRVGAKSM